MFCDCSVAESTMAFYSEHSDSPDLEDQVINPCRSRAVSIDFDSAIDGVISAWNKAVSINREANDGA